MCLKTWTPESKGLQKKIRRRPFLGTPGCSPFCPGEEWSPLAGAQPPAVSAAPSAGLTSAPPGADREHQEQQRSSPRRRPHGARARQPVGLPQTPAVQTRRGEALRPQGSCSRKRTRSSLPPAAPRGRTCRAAGRTAFPPQDQPSLGNSRAAQVS